MAVVDITKLARYHAIFPELTPLEAETCVLAGMGIPVKSIAFMRQVSDVTVKKTMERIRYKLGMVSIVDIKIAVGVRISLMMLDKLQ